jgi:NAD(P)-dependent dehydrogenase (short-subunit alcohol dehydrogenase family)
MLPPGPNFERKPYDLFVAYGRSKTANILFAVAFDRRNRERGVRAAAEHPGGIQTDLGRHLDPSQVQTMIEQMNKQLAAEGKAPFQWKTIPQGAATSVWAGMVAPADEIGGRYCENCHVGKIMPDDEHQRHQRRSSRICAGSKQCRGSMEEE